MQFCDYHFLEGVRIIKYVITIFKIAIPIILIIMGTYDFVQSVIDPNKNTIRDQAISFGKRVAAACIIFLIPSIITLVFGLVTNISDTMLKFNDCIKNANKEYIAVLKQYAKEQREANKEEDKEYVTTYDKDKYVGNSTIASGELLETADQIWKDVASGNYTYGGSGSLPPTNNQIDCSAYISWILFQMGYEEFSSQHATGSFMTTNWNEKYGWEEIDVEGGQDVSSMLQPGDILVRDNGGGVGAAGHINITVSVEDGKVMAYDCGSSSNWKNSGGEPVDKTKFAASDSRPGKIIRVNSSNDD